jgi:putative transposase
VADGIQDVICPGHQLTTTGEPRVRLLIRDRNCKLSSLFDTVFRDGVSRSCSAGVQMPKINSIMKRWVQGLASRVAGLHAHLESASPLACAVRFEHFCNEHRPLRATVPLRPLPESMTGFEKIPHLDVRRRDRLGGILHEYRYTRLTRTDE